jgi:hypothetical protein
MAPRGPGSNTMPTCEQLQGRLHQLESELPHIKDPDAQAAIADEIQVVLMQMRNQGCPQARVATPWAVLLCKVTNDNLHFARIFARK